MTDEVAATVTLSEKVKSAVRTMKRGARMRLDGIPDDPSFLSNNYGPDVTAEIARMLDENEQLRGSIEGMQIGTFYAQDADGLLRRWYPPTLKGADQ